MKLKEIKTITITEKGQIAIPKILRDLNGFCVGSKISLLAFDDKIELRPLSQITKKLETAIASEASLKKDWLSKEEDEAWKDL